MQTNLRFSATSRTIYLTPSLLTHSKEFEDQNWNPYNDICAIKAFRRTNNPVRKVHDWCMIDA